MKKTIVNFIKGKTITLEIDADFANLFQNFLLSYITSAKNPNDVVNGYKKIEQILKGQDVQFTEYESYLYALTALSQNMQKCALEQGVAKKVEMPAEIVQQSKQLAETIMKGEVADDIQQQFKELSEKINNLT